jgi:lysozyme
MTREVSPDGVNLAETFESWRPVAYDDKQPNKTDFKSVDEVLGVPTIAFGHTRGVTKQDVVDKRTVTRAQGDAYEAEDLAFAIGEIYHVMPETQITKLAQHQFDALVCFVFNCGLDPKWKLSQLLKAGRFDEALKQMGTFTHSGGVLMQGLVNRRRAEADLWNAPDGHPAPMTPAGIEYAPASTACEAAPCPALVNSRTFIASMVSGVSGVGSAATAAVPAIEPHAADNHVLSTLLTIMVTVSAAAAFAAAFFKAQDHAGGAVA